MKHGKHDFKGKRIKPSRMTGGLSAVQLVDGFFNAYNGARIAEVCRLLAEKALKKNVTLGVSLSGALTPAGLGASAIVPLIEAGFIDYIVSTGANLYHDIHYGLGLALHKSSPFVDDTELRKKQLIRIYDIIFDFNVLLKSDKYVFDVVGKSEFQKRLSTSELHHLIGKYMDETEKKHGTQGSTVLGAAYRAGVPVYCPSPGDSTIGMNIAAQAVAGKGLLTIDVVQDVNETAAIVLDATRNGESGVLIFGGGSPKNFMLQTEPQLSEILNIPVRGHDYFMQITDARPDTGGLSGATPSEAVSWGKINPAMLPNTVVAYVDTTVAMPIITAYVLTKVKPRKQKRLYDRRHEMVEQLKKEYRKNNK
ncbi:MAG: deoxyhypusine synthase [Nitrospinae bacterium]|nr:deoxyhypusine synthase [Nitrospinota bacterium]